MIPTHIIIHHSLTEDSRTVSWDAIRWFHTKTNGWTKIGYHAGIELVGNTYEILLGRMLDETGAHCKGRNSDSIGICVVGNFDTHPVPPAQLDKLVEYVRSLMSILKIPIENINKHSDFAPYKSCPGKMFQWGEFMGRL